MKASSMCVRSLVLVAGLAASLAPGQTTLYVNGKCGNDTWTGISEVCAAPDGPKKSIKAAITAAVDDDTVLVADGVYGGSMNTNMSFGGKRLLVKSRNGPGLCIIDATSSGRAFGFADVLTLDSILDGFTIRNGTGQPGGAFWFHHRSDALIRNCIITGNSSTWGGAVYTETDARPTFLNCTFIGNTAQLGGAFSAQQATRPSLINCVFTGNTAAEGGAIYVTHSAIAAIINCTIEGNTATAKGGGLRIATGTANVHNTIVWNNSAPSGAQMAVGLTGMNTGTLTTGYSLIQGGQAGVFLEGAGVLNWLAGNQSADPRFVNAAAQNLRLRLESPAIDAADNTALPLFALTDRDGNARFVDVPVVPDIGLPGPPGGEYVADIGAYEVQVSCYANCDGSTAIPVLTGNDFQCFFDQFAAASVFANCDQSTGVPALTANDFQCFINAYAAGCS